MQQQAVAPLQKRDRFTQRPDALAQVDDLLFHADDLMEGLLVGCEGQLFLDIDNPLAESFKNREIAVDNSIDQGVGQIIGPHAANFPLAVPDPVTDRVKDIAIDPLLKGEQIVPSENHAELFGTEIPPLRRAQHLQHDEEIVVIILDLGALHGIDDIFQYQRMKSMPFAQGADQFDVMYPFDIYPHDGTFAGSLQIPVYLLEVTLLDSVRRIADNGNLHLFGRFIPDMH